MVEALKRQKSLPGSAATSKGEKNNEFRSPTTPKRKSVEVRLLSTWTW